MQTIFYNARIMTLNSKEPDAEAMLVNDGSIVFVGKKDEVLALKQADTKLVDLKNKTVLPTFFDNNCRVYSMIEVRLKTAKKSKYLENYHEKDESYEIFDNFEYYKKEFLKIQNEFLKVGITTIQELDITQTEFVLWKKLSEEKLLKLDVIGYVNMLTSKKVMDDNCRTYRKYKNGFRLGGYSLALDGNVFDKTAWLSKPYKGEKGYRGYTEFFDEQLSFLIKTALEEKKQLVVSASGDKSVEQFVNCFENVVKQDKIEDKFRPVIMNAEFLSKKHLIKMKELEIIPSFQIGDIINREKELIKIFGIHRAKKLQPYALLKQQKLEFILQSKSDVIESPFKIIFNSMQKTKLHSKKSVLEFNESLTNHLLTTSERAFDEEQKGTLESGKKANFLVVEKSDNIKDSKVEAVYLQGEKVKI